MAKDILVLCFGGKVDVDSFIGMDIDAPNRNSPCADPPERANCSLSWMVPSSESIFQASAPGSCGEEPSGVVDGRTLQMKIPSAQ